MTIHDLLLDFDCPVCGAEPREDCETNDGQARFEPHRERWDEEHIAAANEHPLSHGYV